MTVTLNHNPFTWFDNDPDGEAKLNRLREERAQDGLSWWDWINFDEFYATTIRHVSEHYAVGDISPTTLLDDAFTSIDLSVKELLDANAVIDSASYDRLDSSVYEKEKKALDSLVTTFFTTALPNLPYSDKEYAPMNTPREEVILAPEDLTYIGSHMKHLFLSGLDMFIEFTNSYPATLEDPDDWTHILKQIRTAVAEIGPGKPLGGVALDNLVKYYPSLWD